MAEEIGKAEAQAAELARLRAAEAAREAEERQLLGTGMSLLGLTTSYAQWQAREEKRQAEEKHRNEADAERRESIEGKIAIAIATVIKQFSGEMTEVQASEIVDAVIDGKIPHLRIDYAKESWG